MPARIIPRAGACGRVTRARAWCGAAQRPIVTRAPWLCVCSYRESKMLSVFVNLFAAMAYVSAAHCVMRSPAVLSLRALAYVSAAHCVRSRMAL